MIKSQENAWTEGRKDPISQEPTSYPSRSNKLIPLVNSILEFRDQIGHINMLKMRLSHQFAQEK